MGEYRRDKEEKPLGFIEEEILLREYFTRSNPRPNVEAELMKIHQKVRPIFLRSVTVWSGVAATLLLVAFAYFWWPNKSKQINDGLLVYKLKTENQEVTLQSGDSEAYAISEQKLSTLPSAPAYTDGGLSYTQVDLEGKVSEEIITVPNGKIFKLVLQDGSIVWLNAHSTLKFPNRFATDERRVTLNGEAYFKIAENKLKPFFVETKGVLTKVLGTEFNVKNEGSSYSEVLLLHGKVQVEDQKKSKSRLLKPGELLVMDTQARFKVNEIDLESYYSWHDGYFYFDDITLAEALKELGRWYNVDVLFENRAAGNTRIRFTADRHESQKTVINMLNELKIAAIELDGDRIIVR